MELWACFFVSCWLWSLDKNCFFLILHKSLKVNFLPFFFCWCCVFTNSNRERSLFLQMSGGDLGVSAFPEGESIFTWIGTIEGGKGTMYEGLSYKLSLRFPMDYPFKPPQIKFETMCFHPNVDQFGNICLDILQVSIKVDRLTCF